MPNLYFYIIWSNKCKELSFHDILIDDDNWINFMIDNCDCSGVEYLKFILAQFRWELIDNNEIIVPKFINKFTNLKKISIDIFHRVYKDFLKFWQCLNVFVCEKKETIYVALELKSFNAKDCREILRCVEKDRLKIDSIQAEISSCGAEMMGIKTVSRK